MTGWTMRLRSAFRHPDRVLPALGATAQCWRRTRGLPGQLDLLNNLREEDEYLLIVLDACRYDELEREWSAWFEGDLQAAHSAGHDTFEYVSRVWDRKHADGDQHDVTYCSGATPVHKDLVYEDRRLLELTGGFDPGEHIDNIREVWRDGWDPEVGVCPPEPVTDAALETDADRVVAHYFQPHAPYLSPEGSAKLGHHGEDNESSRPGQGEPIDKPIWEAVEDGTIPRENLREYYRENLRRVLWEVSWLIQQTDHENVVVMADHGEALGEWGFWAHPRQVNLAHVRTVPWGRVQATKRTQEPPLRRDGGVEMADSEDATVRERLDTLGYI